jgi:predicted MPP superfamily phosphohydrolase
MTFLQRHQCSDKRLSQITVLSAVLLGLGGLTYAHSIEPKWIDVNHVSLPLPRLHPSFDGYRLVQISDLHIDGGTNRQRLEEAVELVRVCEPDLVAITGDFITHFPGRYAADLIRWLGKLRAPDGVVGVLGNHDHGGNAPEVRAILRAAGVTDLSNAVQTLRRGQAALHLCGVDDPLKRQARLDRVLERLPEEGPAILLAHEPDYADISAATGRFALQLSGHTHGGQVRLPFVGPLFLPRWGRKYPQGFYKVKGMLLYTNRGLGTAHLTLRFNCRPEITVFTLKAPAGEGRARKPGRTLA